MPPPPPAIPLPVLGPDPCRRERRSRAGHWRAAVLLGVHLLAAVHIAHWLRAGSSLTPLEPSEAMEFCKHGLVNAGALFFALTILSTAVLGRWFCGWACHLVALQDLCRWLMRKAGVTPRPLRSRLLAWVPAGAFAYMFLWPLGYRLVQGHDLGPSEWQLTNTGFWATFPGFWIALLTFLVCGFAAVYFLGAKGFCTYGCPYGAAFRLADRLAPLRIRVTEACAGCGRCTAVCSSNVLVHEEVRRFGAVVDPGCMKCLDCVQSCPTGALYVGWGKPSLASRARDPRPIRAPAPLPWREELVAALAFAAALFAFYGLNGQVPFLLALGWSGVLAFLSLVAYRMATAADVRLLRWKLKHGGVWQGGGYVFLGLFLLLEGLWAHSALVRYHAWQRTRALAAGDWPAAASHAGFVARWALLRDPGNELDHAYAALRSGRPDEFERRLRGLIAADPRRFVLRFEYGNFLARSGRGGEALAEYEHALAAAPRERVAAARLAELHVACALVLAEQERFLEAEAQCREALDLAPGDPLARQTMEQVRAAAQSHR